MASKRTLLLIGVSERASSSNGRLLALAEGQEDAAWDTKRLSSLSVLPLFAPGKEATQEILDVRSQIEHADACLISSPEYIHSAPAALKNLLEWTVGSNEFFQKPVAIWTASPYSRFVLPQLEDILRTMTAAIVPEACGAPKDPSNEAAQEFVREKLQRLKAVLLEG